MRLIYSQGFSKNERLEWKPVVFNNVVQAFRLISDAMNELGIKFENEDNEASPPVLNHKWRWLVPQVRGEARSGV